MISSLFELDFCCSQGEDRLLPGNSFSLSVVRVFPDKIWFCFTSSDRTLLESNMGISPPGLISRPRPWGSTAHRVAIPASTLGLWLRDASGPQYHPGPAGATPPSPSSAYRSLPFGRSSRPEGLASDTGRYLKLGLNCQVSCTMRLRSRTFLPLLLSVKDLFVLNTTIQQSFLFFKYFFVFIFLSRLTFP